MQAIGDPLRHALWLVMVALAFGACAPGGHEAIVDEDDELPDHLGAADGYDSVGDFFAPGSFYFVRIDGWPSDRMDPSSLEEAVSFEGAQVRIYEADPDSPVHCPDGEVGEDELVHETEDFTLRTRGNFTRGMPKSSYRIKFTNKDARLFRMRGLNLMSMWNDVSQMREAVAWRLFRNAGVHAPQHAYARLCINDRYYGLYSIVEGVDGGFLRDRFGRENNDGNLYKGQWADIGPATLAYRGERGDDYYSDEDFGERSYELGTNDDPDDPAEHQTYDDLAQLARAIEGVGLSDDSEERFSTDEYRESVEAIFDVRTFLRWASINVLLGAWDNYWGTPANYFVYNSGYRDGGEEFMERPYFHWVPWDYDNIMGIDYFDVDWHRCDLVDWEAATAGYYDDGATSDLPMIRNLLRNDDFLAYYLDHVEFALDHWFNEDYILGLIGEDETGGFWDSVRTSAYLEAGSPDEAPHTGRRFTNDQIYWNGYQHQELHIGDMEILGILHYVRMRHDRARYELEQWREIYARGESGAVFPAAPTLPLLPADPG